MAEINREILATEKDTRNFNSSFREVISISDLTNASLRLNAMFGKINKYKEEIYELSNGEGRQSAFKKNIRENVKLVLDSRILIIEEGLARLKDKIQQSSRSVVSLKNSSSMVQANHEVKNRRKEILGCVLDDNEPADRIQIEESARSNYTVTPMQKQETKMDNEQKLLGISKKIDSIANTFMKMNDIISIHDQMFLDIETKTKKTHDQIRNGKRILKGIFESVEGNRSLIIKVFAFIFVIAVLTILLK